MFFKRDPNRTPVIGAELPCSGRSRASHHDLKARVPLLSAPRVDRELMGRVKAIKEAQYLQEPIRRHEPVVRLASRAQCPGEADLLRRLVALRAA